MFRVSSVFLLAMTKHLTSVVSVHSVPWTKSHRDYLWPSIRWCCTWAGLQESRESGRARSGGNRGRPDWCSTSSWRTSALDTHEKVDAEPIPSHILGVDYMISSSQIDIKFRSKHQFTERL